MARKICGPEREEMTGDWRKLHNEELHNFHSLLSIIRVIKIDEDGMVEACSTHGRDSYSLSLKP